MYRTRIVAWLGILSCISFAASSNENEISHKNEHSHQHNMMHDYKDKRISLELTPQMKMHQLANMRTHVEAIQIIIGLIGNGDFIEASKVAHAKLGLTEEMKNMCNSFENEGFRNLGLEFHKSADLLAEVLKTKDMRKSLEALHNTMDYCVQCHATYRQ